MKLIASAAALVAAIAVAMLLAPVVILSSPFAPYRREVTA